MNDNRLTIHEAHRLLKNKQASSVELTKACLERIRQVEPRVHALVSITDELALKQAQKADERIAAGDTNPLTGIPAVIKDVICTKGIRTTCSSRMLENFVPPYDATVVEKLSRHNMVMMGKVNSYVLKARRRLLLTLDEEMSLNNPVYTIWLLSVWLLSIDHSTIGRHYKTTEGKWHE